MTQDKTSHRCGHCGQQAPIHWRVDEPGFALGVSACGCALPQIHARGDAFQLIRWLEEQEGPEIAAMVATLRTMLGA